MKILKNSLVPIFMSTALLLENTGYTVLNSTDGSNILCDLDPTCRKLTEDEITFLTPYFNDQIDYGQVNVFERSQWTLNRPNHAGSASYNAVYLPLNNQQFDPENLENLGETGVFLHELTHIWQYQNSQSWWQFRLGTKQKDNLVYSYELNDSSEFSDFGIEQQASIMMNVYYKRTIYSNPELLDKDFKDNYMSPEDISEWIQNACSNDLKKHESVAQTALPWIEITDCQSLG